MFSLDRWQEIGSTLAQNKLRTTLTMLAMSWGIFMLVALLGLGKGLENGVSSGFADDAVNSIWIWGGQSSIPHEGMPVGRRVVFDNADVDTTRRVPGVEQLTGRFRFASDELHVRAGDKVSAFDVRSVHPGHQYLEKTIMVHGRFLNEEDVALRRKVAVIGLPVADYLYGRRDVVGERLEVNRVSFQVVGVFDDEGGEVEQRKIYLPISTAQAAFNGADRVNQIMFTVDPDMSVDGSKALAEQVKGQLGLRHKFSPADPQAIRVRNNVEAFERFQKVFSMISIFVWLMGGCTIVAGVVGVSNIMMIIVRERTREIGIRKALGATPWDIVGTIVQEALVLTAVAGYMGLVAGVALLELIGRAVPKNEMFHHPQVDLRIAVAATVLLMGAGAIAGFFPARAAARVNPIVALREE